MSLKDGDLGGGLRIGNVNNQFFFTKDNLRSQPFDKKEEAISSLRNHKVRWFTIKQAATIKQ